MKRGPVLLLVACALVLAALAVVRLGNQDRPGRAEFPDSTQSGPSITPEQERELHRVATLGYVAGSVPVPDEVGVVQHREGAYGGYTLFTFPRGPRAVLIDMEGRQAFSWSAPGSAYWPRAHLYRDGDLLVLTCDPQQLMKIDRDSKVVWRFEKLAHHDFDVLSNGSICVLVREGTSRPHIHDGSLLLDDIVVVLDPVGHEMKSVSLLAAFENSERYANWLEEKGVPDGPDIFHTNSVEVFWADGRMHALLSIRALDTIAILDMDEGEIVWAITGPWHMQHEAQLVNGNVLLFDNLGLGDQSRVLEIDVDTREILWSYTAEGFFTRGVGAQQRLPNGNTLITESENGRIIEVTRAGDIVWEYINPLTIEPRQQIILGIMRAERLPQGFPLDWIPRSET